MAEIKGLEITMRLMEQYRQLISVAQSAVQEDTGEAGTVYAAVQQSKRETAAVLAEISRAMDQIRNDATAFGYQYKLEAFEAHYIRGESYEAIALKAGCGRNSPARWCGEIMRKLAVQLFGANGVSG